MEKLTITKIVRYTTNKEGEKLINRNGKPYERVSIKTEEKGDKWISGFGSRSNQEWKEGDVVEVNVVQNGEYLNFETPRSAISPNEFNDLKVRMDSIESRLSALEMGGEEPTSDDSNVPFWCSLLIKVAQQ